MDKLEREKDIMSIKEKRAEEAQLKNANRQHIKGKGKRTVGSDITHREDSKGDKI